MKCLLSQSENEIVKIIFLSGHLAGKLKRGMDTDWGRNFLESG